MLKKFWNHVYDVIDLHEHGINNYAFDIVSAIMFLCEAASHDIIILGGDILNYQNAKYIESCYNWHSESVNPTESLEDAVNYLRKYLLRENADHLVKISVVLSVNLYETRKTGDG